MILAYDWAGGTEAMLRFGPSAGPVVIAALPPFEEANRVRALGVTMLRDLADRGIAGVLPDLPGQGESLLPTEQASLDAWQGAFASAAAAIGDPVFSVSIRAGALIDSTAQVRARWRLAPQTGSAIIRDLVRTRQAAARQAGERFDASDLAPPGPPVALAGNRIARELLRDLQAAEIAGSARVVRLDGDPQPADAHVGGAPLWRRAEPDNDPALAASLASDIEHWVRQCLAA